jgi:hypothetical protein
MMEDTDFDECEVTAAESVGQWKAGQELTLMCFEGEYL